MSRLEDRLEKIALDALAKATEYEGFNLVPDQIEAFGADPVWSLFGMNNEDFLKLRYVGNYYTAIFRKMGDMYEGFVRAILEETLGLSSDDLDLKFTVVIEDKEQVRTLDTQIDVAKLHRRSDATRINSVIHDLASEYKGGKLGFEVRCCYQIGDSKRIQADETAALYLKQQGYLPVLMIFCTTSLKSPVKRLRNSWVVTEGTASYELLRKISGFDLYGFLVTLKPKLTAAMKKVMAVFQLPKR